MEESYDRNKVNQLIENLRKNEDVVNYSEKPKFINNSPKNSRLLIEAFGEVISKKELSNKIRINFQKQLGKLNDNSTKELAFNELQQIINRYFDSDSLRIYISLLSIHHSNTSIAAKEYQALLLGYLASIYKENLLDPLDKSPNIFSTIARIFGILNNFMKDQAFSIHKACSHSMIELFDNCMPKDDVKAILVFFIDPLISIINTGTSKNEQLAATICLSDMVSHLKENSFLNVLENLCPKLISFLNKTKCDSPYLFEALNTILEAMNFDNFVSYLKELYDKLMSLSSSSKNYLTRIEACKALGLIAKKLKPVAELVIGYFHSDIIYTLQNASKDRVHKVQVVANEALKQWLDLEAIYDELEKKKTQQKSDINSDKYLTARNFNTSNNKLQQIDIEDHNNLNKLNKLNLLRNLSKMNKNNREYSPELLKDEIYRKGIGHIINTNNFMKNRESSSALLRKNNTSKFNKSPQHQVKDSIKNFIKNRYKNNFDQSTENLQVYAKEKTNDFNSRLTEEIKKNTFPNENLFEKPHKDQQSLNRENIQLNMINYDDSLDEKLKGEKVPKLLTSHTEHKQEKYASNHIDYHKISDSFFSSLNNMCDELVNTFNNKYIILSKRINKVSETIKTIKQPEKQNRREFLQAKPFSNDPARISDLYSNNNFPPELENKDLFRNKDLGSGVFNNRPLHHNGESLNDEVYKKDYYEDSNEINEENNNKEIMNPAQIDKESSRKVEFETLKNNHLEEKGKITSEMYQKLYNEIYNKIEKKLMKNKPEIVRKWEKALQDISTNNIEAAYENILSSGDDIYLLRLICLTGQILNKLSKEVSKKVLHRVNQISRSHQIQHVTYNLIKQSCDTRLILSISQDEQNEILETLYEYSGLASDIGPLSANLYTYLVKEILNNYK